MRSTAFTVVIDRDRHVDRTTGGIRGARSTTIAFTLSRRTEWSERSERHRTALTHLMITTTGHRWVIQSGREGLDEGSDSADYRRPSF